MLDASDEAYIIRKATVDYASDPVKAKACILTAKTMFPNNFTIQFEAYCMEKQGNHFMEAASCFSNIVLTFPKNPPEIWNEIVQLTAALRVTDGTVSAEQEFYIKMFEHISFEVQQKILLLTAGQSENNLEHCRLIMVLMKRFPQSIKSHSPRLIETLVTGVSANVPHFRDMLIHEVLPLIHDTPPTLPSPLVNRILAICFEYYITQILKQMKDVRAAAANTGKELADLDDTEHWTKLFNTLNMCGRILNWEKFLPFDRKLSKDDYYERVGMIVAANPPRPSENKQILFCASIAFMLALQDYMRNIQIRCSGDKSEILHILVDAYHDHGAQAKVGAKDRRRESVERPYFTVPQPCCVQTPLSLVTAVKCWQLLHSNEILQKDFAQLMFTIPANDWLSRFTIDCTFYVGGPDECRAVLVDAPISPVERYLRALSIIVGQPTIDVPLAFELIIKIMNNLPAYAGEWMRTLKTQESVRHLVLLPLTRRPIVQYCVMLVLKGLHQKLVGTNNCSDQMLGNLLVILQLNWPTNSAIADQVFGMIQARHEFTYFKFCEYIVCPDMIEQFMWLWNPQGGDMNIVFTAPSPASLAAGTRRIGTRGADKGAKDDFKQLIKQQMAKSNVDLASLIERFLVEENMSLVANMFEK